MQELCKNCKNKNTCKEIDNYDKYCQDHIRLRKESALFDCEPSKCCLFEEELFAYAHVIRKGDKQCGYIRQDIYDNLQSKYDNLQSKYDELLKIYDELFKQYITLKNKPFSYCLI